MGRRLTDGARIGDSFDARARAFDAFYEPRTPLARLLYAPVAERLARTLERCGDVRGITILDAGCGSGRYAVELARRGAHVTGIDLAPAMLELARDHAAAVGVADRCTFEQATIEQLGSEPRHEIVLAIGVLDYVADPRPILRALANVTGSLLVASHPRELAWRFQARRISAAVRPAAPRVHAHSATTIKAALDEQGFRIVECERGMAFAAR